jgi:hypothetical protein
LDKSTLLANSKEQDLGMYGWNEETKGLESVRGRGTDAYAIRPPVDTAKKVTDPVIPSQAHNIPGS